MYFYNQIIHLSVKRVNERRYEFGDENGAESWVCAKIPHDGAIKKDCVPKVIEIGNLCLSFKYRLTHSGKYDKRNGCKMVISEGGSHLVCPPSAEQGL